MALFGDEPRFAGNLKIHRDGEISSFYRVLNFRNYSYCIVFSSFQIYLTL